MGLVRVAVKAADHVGPGIHLIPRYLLKLNGSLILASYKYQAPAFRIRSKYYSNFGTTSIVQHKPGIFISTIVGRIRGSHSGLCFKVDLEPKDASLEVVLRQYLCI